jgi:hypothetical protein
VIAHNVPFGRGHHRWAEPAAGRGTTFTGKVGLNPAVMVVIPVIAGVGGLIALGALAGGVALLAEGQLGGLLPAMLIPLALTTGEILVKPVRTQRLPDLSHHLGFALLSCTWDHALSPA